MDTARAHEEPETTQNRSERREEIKLRLEYLKLTISFFGVLGIVFAGLQWKAGTRAALQNALNTQESIYQKIDGEWLGHVAVFVSTPELRPYFYERKRLEIKDPNRSAVLATADIRLSVMDAILTYVDFWSPRKPAEGWRQTFIDAFRQSPVLCSRFFETQNEYGLIVPLGQQACDASAVPR